MSRVRALVLAAGLLPAAAPSVAAQACPPARPQPDLDLARVFAAHDVAATFVLLDMATGTCARFDPERAATPFLPASTFKIFNSMIALDEGAIPDADAVLEWDGTDRGSPGWNESQDMRTAFRRSTVWFYQELARRIGEPRMRTALQREDYGNADPAGGIDRFWLDGSLRISADEQALFVRRLLRNELGFSDRAQQLARELLVMERSDAYTLAGKTGWTESDGNQLGWYVGFVVRNGATHIFAMNFESGDPEFPMREARESLLRQILSRLNLVPER